MAPKAPMVTRATPSPASPATSSTPTPSTPRRKAALRGEFSKVVGPLKIGRTHAVSTKVPSPRWDSDESVTITLPAAASSSSGRRKPVEQGETRGSSVREAASSTHLQSPTVSSPSPAVVLPTATASSNPPRLSLNTVVSHFATSGERLPQPSEDSPRRHHVPVSFPGHALNSLKAPAQAFSPVTAHDLAPPVPLTSRNIFNAAKSQPLSFQSRAALTFDRPPASLAASVDAFAPEKLNPEISIDTILGLQKLLELVPLSDDELPLPEAYNAAYPHPISAYASPGVNPASLAVSGYDKILAHMLAHQPDVIKGTILANAGSSDVFPPALTLVITPGEGNGIPERLWSRFESFGAARLHLPFGVGGGDSAGGPSLFSRDALPSSSEVSNVSTFARDPMPPRFAHHHCETRTESRGQTHSEYSLRAKPDGQFKYEHHLSIPQHLHLNDVNYLQKHTSSPLPLDYVGQSSGRIDICPVWEDTGICRNGRHCPYAHGLHELSGLQTPILPPTPSTDYAPSHHYLKSAHMERESSPPVSKHASSTFEGIPMSRRASAPPNQLGNISELESSHQWWPDRRDTGSSRRHHHRSSPESPAQRYSPPGIGVIPAFADNIWSPSYGTSLRYPSPRDTPHSVFQPQSSLSSSSHNTYLASTSPPDNRLSCFTAPSDKSASNTSPSTWSPVDSFSGPASAHQEVVKCNYPRDGEEASIEKWEKGVSSTSLDFSTGKSIWC